MLSYDTALAFGAIATLALYVPLWERRATQVALSALDRRVPFVPLFAFIYAAFFLAFPAAAILLAATPFWEPFLVALIVAGVLFLLVTPFVTHGARHGEPQGKGFSRALVRQIYRLDGERPRRSFPSVHAYLAFICAFYLSLAHPAFAAVLWGLAGLIAASTVFIRQHILIDLAGSVAFAALAISAARVLAA